MVPLPSAPSPVMSKPRHVSTISLPPGPIHVAGSTSLPKWEDKRSSGYIDSPAGARRMLKEMQSTHVLSSSEAIPSPRRRTHFESGSSERHGDTKQGAAERPPLATGSPVAVVTASASAVDFEKVGPSPRSTLSANPGRSKSVSRMRSAPSTGTGIATARSGIITASTLDRQAASPSEGISGVASPPLPSHRALVPARSSLWSQPTAPASATLLRPATCWMLQPPALAREVLSTRGPGSKATTASTAPTRQDTRSSTPLCVAGLQQPGRSIEQRHIAHIFDPPAADSPRPGMASVLIPHLAPAPLLHGHILASHNAVLEANAQEAINQMELDLPRTYPEERTVAARLGVVRSMMIRHIAEDPDVGYCQGLNCVAAVFAVAGSGQEEAYARFRAFTRRVRGLWLPGFPLFQDGAARFATLVAARPWFQHLQAKNIEPSMYLPQAWMSLFASWLPLSILLHCLGLLENDGFPAILAITLAVLDSIEQSLLEQKDMPLILEMLTDLRESAPTASQLLTAARARLSEIVSSELQAELAAAEGKRVSWNQSPSLARNESAFMQPKAGKHAPRAGPLVIAWSVCSPPSTHRAVSVMPRPFAWRDRIRVQGEGGRKVHQYDSGNGQPRSPIGSETTPLAVGKSSRSKTARAKSPAAQASMYVMRGSTPVRCASPPGERPVASTSVHTPKGLAVQQTPDAAAPHAFAMVAPMTQAGMASTVAQPVAWQFPAPASIAQVVAAVPVAVQTPLSRAGTFTDIEAASPVGTAVTTSLPSPLAWQLTTSPAAAQVAAVAPPAMQTTASSGLSIVVDKEATGSKSTAALPSAPSPVARQAQPAGAATQPPATSTMQTAMSSMLATADKEAAASKPAASTAVVATPITWPFPAAPVAQLPPPVPVALHVTTTAPCAPGAKSSASAPAAVPSMAPSGFTKSKVSIATRPPASVAATAGAALSGSANKMRDSPFHGRGDVQ